MSDPLGLSIGTTNLVAARVGDQPVTRRAVLTLPTDGAPEIGVSSGRPGQVLSGFVERVGDPVPLVAADGSSYLADDLLVEALEALIGPTGSGQTVIAVPAHWTPATMRVLRAALRANPVLSPGGAPPRLVSDAVTSLTALNANPGLNARGAVVLIDLGGGGTSITLADADAGFEPIDETVRVADFSGDLIDQALLGRVLADADANDTDPAATAAVGQLGVLREQCRQAKERLSGVTATEVPVDLPGVRSVVRVTRAELEALLVEPFALVLSELDNLLQRNRIGWSDISVIATVGGGASIPLVTQKLSEHTRTPVVNTPQPALDAALGAVLRAAYGTDTGAQTGMAPAVGADAPTSLAPAAAITHDPSGSSTFRALAWSEDGDAGNEPVPYTGPEDYPSVNPYLADPYLADEATHVVSQQDPSMYADEPRGLPRVPMAVFAAVGLISLVALGGVAIALTGTSESPAPTPSTAPVTGVLTPPPAEPAGGAESRTGRAGGPHDDRHHDAADHHDHHSDDDHHHDDHHHDDDHDDDHHHNNHHAVDHDHHGHHDDRSGDDDDRSAGHHDACGDHHSTGDDHHISGDSFAAADPDPGAQSGRSGRALAAQVRSHLQLWFLRRVEPPRHAGL
ncbi:Hsp70 family protein [Mycolicibacterium neoaurum]|uniref:Molecular chaperone n=1 Tax=Mycolicibacterium neoaurum TaxID=1795 RepID=A0AAV2WGU5_MYCNE|nr:Hsp70 family protein [Mycolicibacterium neoaurum]CDQ43445.1 molecular chaperone [Mycolicibacterium neoaurum]